MTTLAALLLVAAALSAILYPLRSRVRTGTVSSPASEVEERYRAAMADLQDTELDWESGSLTSEDYATLRDRYRHRAAEALRDLTAAGESAPALTAEPQISIDPGEALKNGKATLVGARHASPAEPSPRAASIMDPGLPAPELPTPLRERMGDGGGPPTYPTVADSPRTTRLIVAVGAACIVAGIAAAALLYSRAVQSQAAQAAVAQVPINHAHAIAVDPSGAIWLGHHDGLLRSSDGRDWKVAGGGDVMGIVQLSGRWLLLGHSVAQQSTDGGATWLPLSNDLPGTDVHGADRGLAGVYAYVVDYGLFRSNDGERWQRSGAPMPTDVSSLAVLPASEGGEWVLLAAGGSVVRSPDGGQTWAPASGAAGGALVGTVRGLAADGEHRLLYAATSDGLFRSTNAGSDWTRLPYRGSAGAVGARGDRVVIVDDDGRVFVSNNGGATW